MSTGPFDTNAVGATPPPQLLSKTPPGGAVMVPPTMPAQVPPTLPGTTPNIQPFGGGGFQGDPNGTVQQDENGNLIRVLQGGIGSPTSVSQEQINARGLAAQQNSAAQSFPGGLFGNQPVGIAPPQQLPGLVNNGFNQPFTGRVLR